MLVTINAQPVNLKVTSLILEPDYENPEMFKAFRCFDCGKVVFQYSGNIVMLVPGGVKVPMPILQMCHGCKKRFLVASSL